jgi:hypothetical protein
MADAIETPTTFDLAQLDIASIANCFRSLSFRINLFSL